MADEQTPQSDLIDDAIRQAERQLEDKLEALRLAALGEPAPQASAPDDDVAILRPTSTSPRTGEPAQPAPAPAPEAIEGPIDASAPDSSPDPEPVSWAETGGDDVSFAPVGGSAPMAGVSDLYVPEDEDPFDQDEPAVDPAASVFGDPAPESDPIRESLTATVTDLTPVWDDEDEASILHSPSPTTRPSHLQAAPEPSGSSAPIEPVVEPAPRERSERPEPVHATWTEPARTRREPAPSGPVTTLPSEDEMQFWAHTRTALRNLQQVTDGIATQVVGGVSTEVSRMLHEELSTTDQSLRALQEQVRETSATDLPALADRVQDSIEQAVAAPNNGIRLLRDELPDQLDRSARQVHELVREDLDRTSAGLHGAVQHDITHLEQSIASNVTRMAQDSTEAIGRVERDMDVLGETVVRFERGVHAEFDRFEAQLRTAIERVEQNLRDELVEPTELVRKLDQEMPSRFNRIEAALTEQLQAGQREQATVLTSLVEADRAALDRLAALGSTLDEDRARRTEDLEVVVDTITTGWEALAGAIATLFEQSEENSRRLAGIEQRLTQLRDVEGAVEQTLDEFTRQMRDLKPSPIVVSVSHDEAEVRSATRGGWVPEQRR